MNEYLQLVVIGMMVVIAFRQAKEKQNLEEQVEEIKGQLEGVEKLLIELQPKGPIEIPVRLDDEIVNEMTEITKREMEEYQLEKAEFQKMMKKIKEEYSDDKDTQYVGTEYDGADRLTREQAQEILKNIKYRKANRLK